MLGAKEPLVLVPCSLFEVEGRGAKLPRSRPCWLFTLLRLPQEGGTEVEGQEQEGQQQEGQH